MVRGILILLAWCGCAFALNPSLDVSQYAHTPWKVRDGFFKGQIGPIAQTPDGYLWVGTDLGLYRFDGVKAVAWQPPPGQSLPSSLITSLLVARDGTLWIGTSTGLASWKDGKLNGYAKVNGHIFPLLEDGEGVLWVSVAAAPDKGNLCTIQQGDVRCSADLGVPVIGLYEDNMGYLWAGVSSGFWRWKPGPPKFYPVPAQRNGIFTFSEDDAGNLLVGTYTGIMRLVDGRLEPYPLGFGGEFRVIRLHRDREGSLWVGTMGQGLLHLHQGTVDTFAQSDGLSSDTPYNFFEDREGTLWAATSDGLDRFRDFAIPTYSANQGLSNAAISSILADRGQGIWLATYGGLRHWDGREVVSYGKHAKVRPGARVREIAGSGLPDGGVQSLFQDGGGRLWITMFAGVGYLEHDRFTFIKGAPRGNVFGLTEDSKENLWIANQEHGLFQLSRNGDLQHIPWDRLGQKDIVSALVADRSKGGMWIGFLHGRIVYLVDGEVRASYSAPDGLGQGRVNDLRLDRDGTLWAATVGGLSRIKNSRVATLNSKNGLPCDSIHWSIADDDRSLWMYTSCGLMRIACSDLDAWAAAVDGGKNSSRTIQPTVFDASDGIRSMGGLGGYVPHVAKSPDGRIWFAAGDGVSVIDPRHLRVNKLLPPVHVEKMVVDRETHAIDGNMRLPPLVRDLEIDYTALSMVAAEKVFFRVKLEGRDPDWKDVGNERKAFYTDLPPRNYRFRVMASNNNGVWNEAGASFDFSVKPAYYQTTWFRASRAAAFLGLLWALYWYRLHQIAQRFKTRLDERTRIARELHDTMLQSFQASLAQMQAGRNLLSRQSDRALQAVDDAITMAAGAIAEGRNAVGELRSSAAIRNDLAEALKALGDELAAGGDATFQLVVEGPPRDLHPVIQDEICRIGGEALRNAFRHSRAQHIETDVRYSDQLLRLQIRDDGIGISSEILEGGRSDHYGLCGMRERAEKIGAKLEIWSATGTGTEIGLSIPAARAYRSSPRRGGRRLFTREWK
jgi:signal transduction histidine kinase/ligand-binding sensor domain-containing protein